MAIKDKRITNSNGISYSKEVTGSADWINIVNDTYFKDLSDGLIYWKDLSGEVIAIYELGGISANTYTTGTTIVGTTAYFDRTDSLSAYTLDLSTIGGGDSDYGNIIFVSEVGPTGQTRADVVGDILKPVDLEWASQIAQSGDTIHVKAGSYTATTTSLLGLTVNGVNHYFEVDAKVYKSTAGPMFGRDASFIVIDGNVYGNGSFYTDGACQYTYFSLGFTSIQYSGFYSNPSIFEFDECISSSNTAIVLAGFGVSSGDVIIKGKTRMINSAGHAISRVGSFGEKLTIDCPYIATTMSSSNAIVFGNGAGGGGEIIINSMIIEATGGPNDIAIKGNGSEGRLTCTATYIDNVSISPTSRFKQVIFNVGRIDKANTSGTIVEFNGHVGNLFLNKYTNVDVKLCDELGIINFNVNSTANIMMSNITGATNTLGGSGTVNLSCTDITSFDATEYPNNWINYFGKTGPKDYLIAGSDQQVNLVGRWDNGDTFTHGIAGPHTLKVSSDSYIKETTFTSDASSSSKLEIQGKTEDCQINHVNGDIVINGATMLVSDQNKAIITAPNPGSSVKVYSGGLNTNKFGPFTGATEMIKVDVTAAIVQVTINGETFTTVTSVIAGQAAQELAGLINGSGTVGVTASQDTPGADTYIYVTSNTVGFGITISYDSNTSFNEQIRYNSNVLTDIVGGTVIEDVNID